jgi:hypothetical protein
MQTGDNRDLEALPGYEDPPAYTFEENGSDQQGIGLPPPIYLRQACINGS